MKGKTKAEEEDKRALLSERSCAELVAMGTGPSQPEEEDALPPPALSVSAIEAVPPASDFFPTRHRSTAFTL